MRKQRWLLATGMILVLGLSACQKSPDSSIVVNKDLDNLIDEAQNTGSGTVDVGSIAENYDTYQVTLQDESLGVTVNVDAKVDIPTTDQMSVIRVAQTSITQEFLTKVQEELVQGETLYDGAALEVRTKRDIELEIQGMRDILNESADEDISYMQEEIDQLQEEYETAPTEISFDDYKSDGQIHSVEELYQSEIQKNQDGYYSWKYDLNPNGEIYYGVSDGANGNYLSLYVQNDENYGNSLSFRKDTHGYSFVSFPSHVDLEEANIGTSNLAWRADESIPDNVKLGFGGDVEFVEITDEPVSISQEQAIETAEAFIDKMELGDFQYYDGGLYNEVQDIRYQNDFGDTAQVYRKQYILTYMRNIDGAFVTFESASKHEEGWNGGDYVKKFWAPEVIQFRINDSGIIGFDYIAPLEMVETVVEQSNMKTFDEVKETFETMVVAANAQDVDMELGEQNSVTIEIDRVVLGYARISEADRYDTGLLVPVWDFKGTRTDAYGQQSYGSILTINAIDGSIVDRTLGY